MAAIIKLTQMTPSNLLSEPVFLWAYGANLMMVNRQGRKDYFIVTMPPEPILG